LKLIKQLVNSAKPIVKPALLTNLRVTLVFLLQEILQINVSVKRDILNKKILNVHLVIKDVKNVRSQLLIVLFVDWKIQ
jgi:hypothetical protein